MTAGIPPAPPASGGSAGAGAASVSTSRWTGRFANLELETRFLADSAPERSRRLRAVSLLGTGLMMLFGVSDYLTLGFGGAFLFCLSARLLVLASGVATALASERGGSVQALERNVLAVMILLPSALHLLIAMLGRGMETELPGYILMTLCYYLFLPLPLPSVVAASSYGGIGFLVISVLFLAPTPTLIWLSFIELLLCNVLGGYTALRTQVMLRRQWLGVRELRRRAQFEDLVARQSTRFITLPLEQIGPGIDAALAEIGEFAGADRSYVFEVDHDRRESSCTHEWCRQGVAPGMTQIQRSPNDEFSWGHRQILGQKPIVAHTLDDLPAEAAAERAACEALSVRSLLVVPMVFGGQMLGSVGFHAIRQERNWDDEQVGLLRQVGALIVGAIVRQRMENELRIRTEALETSVTALEKSNSELQQFAYAASHDLKEPLRVISSFSGLLASRYRGKLDDKADEYIAFLTAAAARMHRLITDLLEYSRFDQPMRPDISCRTGEIAAQALENLAVAIQDSAATVSVGSLPEVPGDPSQLLQLFQNLVGNALKFRRSGPPHITLGARKSETHWEFSVADNGIGLDPRHAEHVFKAFTRLHSVEEFPGTGIGLAICKRIVERHGGRIWVEPHAPAGSIFKFTLAASGPG